MFHHRSTEEKAKRRGSAAKRTGESRGPIKRLNQTASKQDRLHAERQHRQMKRDELVAQKRMGTAEHTDGRPTPPKVVALIPFHTQADVVSLKRLIAKACGAPEDAADTMPPHAPYGAVLPAFAQGGPGAPKSRVIVLDPPRDLLATLDVVKCADVVLAVFGPEVNFEDPRKDPSFDEHGYRLLTALKAQGMPNVIGVIHGCKESMAKLAAKRGAEAKKTVARFFNTEFGADHKMFTAGTLEETKTLVRALGGVTPKDLSWRSDRGYLMAQDAQYSAEDGVLCLRGYVRGAGLSCKHMVHITGHGDFPIARIAVAADPVPLSSGRSSGMDQQEAEKIVDELKEEPDRQNLRPYDPTAAEQTWPSADELRDADSQMMPPPAVLPRRRRNRAGVIPRMGVEGEDADMDDAEDGESGQDDGEDDAESVAPSFAAETDDGWDVNSTMTMETPNAENVAAEKRRRKDELVERSQEDMEFPDEVDTPLHNPAKTRFQRYRGLKSFRTSAWDPYEDLPMEYSRIWEFEAFASTARACKATYDEDCAAVEGGGVGSKYCHVYIKGVPPSVLESQPRGVPFVLSNLFPLEQKVSVIHSSVTRHRGHEEPVKSKQELSLHCGFRRLMARPTFSEIPKKSTSSKKYKFMRFLHEDASACASFYAPVVFPPNRLLMFANTPTGPDLVASGAIDSVDPKRLLIKRIVLTGYPFRVHKGKGVVRFMFFQPDDVRWFKPVELSTKKGLRGHITASVGTHGYMKCRFSNHIKQDDTICMNLYKRVYPKWYPPVWGGAADATAETA